MGGNIILKKNVVPHIFNCQLTRKHTHEKGVKPAFKKRRTMDLLREISENPITTASETITPDVEHLTTTGKCDVSVQTDAKLFKNEKHFRSKFVQCNHIRSHDSATSPIKLNKCHATTSPLKIAVLSSSTSPIKRQTRDVGISPLKLPVDDTELDGKKKRSFSDIDYEPSEADSETDSLTLNNDDINFKQECKNLIRKHIKAHSMMYLGVPASHLFIIDRLAEQVKISNKMNANDVVYIVLLKCRNNFSFKMISIDFGISESFCSRIFKRNVGIIANCLKQLITWPDEIKIKQNLSIPFRFRYNHIESIIDCLEIEIEKPTNPVNQALSWSDYKKCNKAKYLV